jgi:hypothetical protein
LKRRIDASNQERTDMVDILMVIFAKNSDVVKKDNAKINSESPAWALTGYRY